MRLGVSVTTRYNSLLYRNERHVLSICLFFNNLLTLRIFLFPYTLHTCRPPHPLPHPPHIHIALLIHPCPMLPYNNLFKLANLFRNPDFHHCLLFYTFLFLFRLCPPILRHDLVGNAQHSAGVVLGKRERGAVQVPAAEVDVLGPCSDIVSLVRI